MTRIDDVLRHAVQDLADRGQPVNLGTRALATARRRRRIRASVAATVTVVLLAGAAVGVVAADRGHHRPKPAESVRPSLGVEELTLRPEAPLVVEGLRLVSYHRGGGPTGMMLVRGRYVEVTDTAALSPAGDEVVAIRTGRVGLLDAQTGLLTASWDLGVYIPVAVQWSPDGTKVLVVVSNMRSGPTLKAGFAIVDPATGKGTVRLIDLSRYHGDWQGIRWHPTGDRVLLSLGNADPRTGQFRVSGLQSFDLAGKPGAVVGVPALVRGPDAWSPDGTHVIGYGLVSSVVGQTMTTALFEGPSWRLAYALEPYADAWWIDDDRLLVVHRDPDAEVLALDVRNRDGRVLKSYRVRDELGIHVGAEGGPDAAYVRSLSFRPVR